MINKAVIFAGAVGGVTPNFLRLIINYSSPSPQPITSSPLGYCLAIAGFALLGAIAAWIFQETDLKRALYVGIGLPSLLQVGTLQLAPSPNTPAVAPPLAGRGASIALVSSVYAQELSSAGSLATGRKLKLSSSADAPQYAVLFYGQDNKWLSTKSAGQVVDVPDAADKFAIQVGDSTSSSYEILGTPNAVMNIKVMISARAGSGFLQGIGLAKVGQYNIAVQVQ